MKNRLSWQSILMIAAPYVMLASVAICPRLSTNAAGICFGFAMLLLIEACALNVFHAIRTRGEGAARQLAFEGLVIKAALIPFYAAMFFLGFLMFAAPPAVIGMILLDWLILLATSTGSLCGIWRGCRSGQLPVWLALLLAASQVTFVLDVPGAAALFWKIRK